MVSMMMIMTTVLMATMLLMT